MLLIQPVQTIVSIFIGTIVISAYIIHVLEIPYFRAQNDTTFDSYFTSIWFTVITLTTIGYGDISPGSPPGQAFTMILAIWGAHLLSLLVVCLTNMF